MQMIIMIAAVILTMQNILIFQIQNIIRSTTTAIGALTVTGILTAVGIQEVTGIRDMMTGAVTGKKSDNRSITLWE